jgi:hypothetical protein
VVVQAEAATAAAIAVHAIDAAAGSIALILAAVARSTGGWNPASSMDAL